MNEDDDSLPRGDEPEYGEPPYPEQRNNAMNNIAQLTAALARAQSEFLPIRRDRTVKVSTRAGGVYTFSYAPLETILAAVRGALAKHELALSQAVVAENGTEYVETTLWHSSGESLRNRVRVIQKEDGPQAYGSALTYARRYGITLLLSICADDDDDANAAEGHSVEVQSRAPATSATQPSGPTPQEVADRFMRAYEVGLDEAIYEVHESVHQDKELYSAAWKLLPAKARNGIKDAIARVRESQVKVLPNGRAA